MIFNQQNLNFRKTKHIRQYLLLGARALFFRLRSPARGKRSGHTVIDLTLAKDPVSMLKDAGMAKRKDRTFRILLPADGGNFQAGIDMIRSNALTNDSKYRVAFELGSFIASIKGKPDFTQRLSGLLKTLLNKWTDAEFLVRLDENNCYWADDVLLVFEELGIRQFFFTISESFIKETSDEKNAQKAAFHILMFFESLQRHPLIGYAESKVYKRLAGLVNSRFLSIIRNTAGASHEFTEDACVFTAPDLLIGITTGELLRESKKLIAGKLSSGKANPKQAIIEEPSSQVQNPNPKNWNKVLITGWYGTETQGDKAILGELLYFIKQCSPECEILLTTIHPVISEQTNTELEDFRTAKLVSLKTASEPALIKTVDAVIIGGGPLTDSSSMREIWKIFSEGNRQEKARIIFGCGIGPLHLPEYIAYTKVILELTSAGFLRDKESKDIADKLCPGNALNVACDPALAFVNRWKTRRQINLDQNTDTLKVGTFLRAMTGEFSKGMSQAKIDSYNKAVSKNLAECLTAVRFKLDPEIQLLHMNAPWIGGDDRIFNRYIEHALENRLSSENIREYLTLNEHLEKMSSLRFSLAMRYHGHIFSLALGIPFLSIDYTGKQGKVSNLLKRIGYENITIKLDDIRQQEFLEKWEIVFEKELEIKEALQKSAGILISELYEVYRRTFDVELYPEQEKNLN